MKLRMMALLLVGILSIGLLAACGGGDDEDPTATTAVETPTATVDSGGGSDDDAVKDGEKVAQANCFTCHSTDGTTLVGPSWKGLYERETELVSGESVIADDDYLHESIVDPNAKIVKGFTPGVMFSFEDLLTEEEIENLIAYIKTL